MFRVAGIIMVFCSAIHAELTVGFAEVAITPERPVPLAGATERKNRPSTGVRDEVWLSACVIDDGTEKAAFIAADLLGIRVYARDAVLAKLPPELGITGTNFVLCATGTAHSLGGLMKPMNNFLVDRMLEAAFGKWDPATFDRLVDRCAQAVLEADAARIPARLAFHTVTEKRFCLNKLTPNGPRDVDLRVMRAETRSGKLLGVFVNYALGPILPWNLMEVSGDIPGWVRAELKAQLGDEVAVLYMNPGYVEQECAEWATGDEVESDRVLDVPEDEAKQSLLTYKPVEAPEATPEEIAEADAQGRRIAAGLAESALSALKRARIERSPVLQCRGAVVTLPQKEGLFAIVAPSEAPLSSVAVGNHLFLCVPGAMTVTMGRNMKGQAAALGYDPWIVGNAGEFCGNFLHPQAYTDRVERHRYRDKRTASAYGAAVGDFLEHQLLDPFGLTESTYERGGVPLPTTDKEGEGLSKLADITGRQLDAVSRLFGASGRIVRKLAENSLKPYEQLKAENEAAMSEQRHDDIEETFDDTTAPAEEMPRPTPAKPQPSEGAEGDDY